MTRHLFSPPQDVLAICEDHRKLACAFHDAWMMIDTAGKCLAPPNRHDKNENNKSNISDSNNSSSSNNGSSSSSGNSKRKSKKRSKEKTIAAASSRGVGSDSKRKWNGQKKKAAKELGTVEKRVGYFLLWARSYGAEATPIMAADILSAGIDTGRDHGGVYLSGL